MSLSADRRSRSLSARRYPLGWIPCPLQVAVPEATSSLQAVIRLDPSTGRRASFRLSALTWNLRKIAQLGFGQISPYHMRRGFPTRYRCLSRLAVLAPCYCPPPPFGERSGIALATFWQWHSFRVWTMEPHRRTSLRSATPLSDNDTNAGVQVASDLFTIFHVDTPDGEGLSQEKCVQCS